jgi:hypothetical protein
MVTLFNGSEIRIGGLGDREQADKILGHEYNTIYFNEISQLSYAAVTTAYSRLAMRTPGRRKLFVYDCNPGPPLHRAYKIFVLKKTFLGGEALVKPIKQIYRYECRRNHLLDGEQGGPYVVAALSGRFPLASPFTTNRLTV